LLILYQHITNTFDNGRYLPSNYSHSGIIAGGDIKHRGNQIIRFGFSTSSNEIPIKIPRWLWGRVCGFWAASVFVLEMGHS